MANVQQLFDSFVACFDSIHVFQSQMPELLPEIKGRNFSLRSLLLDHLNKILSSKTAPPAQKFYGTYFILKALEDKNDSFANELAQKDELITKIFHISQTDAGKNEVMFERGANLYSLHPSKTQSRAGVNLVKLCIELIIFVDQKYGSPDSNNPRNIFKFMGGFLQKKTKIPRVSWFLDKKYEIPKDRELYSWDFNKNTPLIASEVTTNASIEAPEETPDEKKANKNPAMNKVKSLGRTAQAFANDNNDVSDEEEEEEPEQNEEADNLMMTSKSKKVSGLELLDRKESLRLPAKAFKDYGHDEQGSTGKSKSSFLSRFQDKMTFGSAATAENGANSKKSQFSDSTRELEWTPVNREESSPFGWVQKETEKKSALKKSKFNVPEVIVSDEKGTDDSAEVEKKEAPGTQEIVEVPRSIMRELTFNKPVSSMEEQNAGEKLEGSNSSGRKSLGLSERSSSDKNKTNEGQVKPFSKFKPENNGSDKAPLTIEIRAEEMENTERNSKKPPMVSVTPVSTSSTIGRHRFVGPKDLEEYVSPTFSGRMTTSKKIPKLEEDLMKIQNSIRLSMSRSANTVNGRRESMLGNQSISSIPGSSLLNGSKASIEKDLQSEVSMSKKDPFSVSKVSDDSMRQGNKSGNTLNVNWKSKEINTLSSGRFRSDTEVEKKSFFGGSQSQVSGRATQQIGRGTKIPHMVQNSNEKRYSLNVGVKSESGLPLHGLKNNNRISLPENALSTWKCVVVEKTNTTDQGGPNFLNNLSENKLTPKMYSVTELKEIEIRGIEQKEGRNRVNDVFSISRSGKENYKSEISDQKVETHREVSYRMVELLGSYCVDNLKAGKPGRQTIADKV